MRSPLKVPSDLSGSILVGFVLVLTGCSSNPFKSVPDPLFEPANLTAVTAPESVSVGDTAHVLVHWRHTHCTQEFFRFERRLREDGTLVVRPIILSHAGRSGCLASTLEDNAMQPLDVPMPAVGLSLEFEGSRDNIAVRIEAADPSPAGTGIRHVLLTRHEFVSDPAGGIGAVSLLLHLNSDGSPASLGDTLLAGPTDAQGRRSEILPCPTSETAILFFVKDYNAPNSEHVFLFRVGAVNCGGSVKTIVPIQTNVGSL